MIPNEISRCLRTDWHREHGGRRIPESVLERDYCVVWFLVGLSQSRLGQLLIFKGGTALKCCHFGNYRFSEDLDFKLACRAEFRKSEFGMQIVTSYPTSMMRRETSPSPMVIVDKYIYLLYV
jgi:predicted nucleotidyltransferase component of viral defense system